MSGFENAKVGDKVLVRRGNWNSSMEIQTITKVGKLHIEVTGESGKFRRNGSKSGDSWSSTYLVPFDQNTWDEHCAEKREQQMRRSIKEFAWHNCDKELVATVYAMLPKPEEK